MEVSVNLYSVFLGMERLELDRTQFKYTHINVYNEGKGRLNVLINAAVITSLIKMFVNIL